ncbi:MAG TPA: protease complex subunit PrcB family protein [Anaerolineales bacterium]|nr:protease complex subunit PrcB family protein [Anaerolineales bacterium]
MKRAPLLTAYCLLITSYCLLLLSACIPPLLEDGSLSFQTIEQKNDSAYSLQEQYTALEPGLFVIDGEESRARYEVWFGEKGRGQLDRMNFGTVIAVAVFQGWQTTGGYGIEIERIIRVGDVVTVVARFDKPGLGNGNGAITSPYQLVRVSKAGNWHEEIAYELVVAGEVVAVFPTPEP